MDDGIKRSIVAYVRGQGMTSKYQIFMNCKIGYQRFERLVGELSNDGLKETHVGNETFWGYEPNIKRKRKRKRKV